jgi:tetratricopeptide (TPR) repeat protein
LTKWITLAGAIALTFTLGPASYGTDLATVRYNEGNALYRIGSFSEAVSRYEEALATGLRNADVYFNLGNAHYKTGDLGVAMLNYERARRLRPTDADILENIAFASARMTDRFEEDVPNVVTRFLSGIYHAISPNGLAIVVSVSFVLGCFGASAALFSTERRLRWLLVIAVALLTCGLGASLLAMRAADLSAAGGIVLKLETIGRSGPGGDFLQVFTLHEGTKIVLERQEGVWGLIRLPNGIGGWVPLDAVGMI